METSFEGVESIICLFNSCVQSGSKGGVYISNIYIYIYMGTSEHFCMESICIGKAKRFRKDGKNILTFA